MTTAYVQEWKKRVDGRMYPLGFYVYASIDSCVLDTQARVSGQQTRLVDNQNQHQPIREFTAPDGPIKMVEVPREMHEKIKQTTGYFVESLIDLRT
jgi:hypothetical protein